MILLCLPALYPCNMHNAHILARRFSPTSISYPPTPNPITAAMYTVTYFYFLSTGICLYVSILYIFSSTSSKVNPEKDLFWAIIFTCVQCPIKMAIQAVNFTASKLLITPSCVYFLALQPQTSPAHYIHSLCHTLHHFSESSSPLLVQRMQLDL